MSEKPQIETTNKGEESNGSRSSLKNRRLAIWRRRLLFTLFGLFIGFALAEIGLRVLGAGAFLPYQPDEHCGVRLRPGLSGRYLKEGRAFVSINSDGNRDIERNVDKPNGTFRVAVLGDSYAEAMQVDRDEAFWVVLERELSKRVPAKIDKIEVLNFGVSGYGTAQELEMLRHHVWKYQPDLVLLAFLTGNDLMDNSEAIGPAISRPYYVMSDGELTLDNSFLEDEFYVQANSTWTQLKVQLINRSRVLQIINEVKTRWEHSRIDDDDRLTLDELGLDWRVYRPPADEDWEQVWVVTEAILERIQQECQANNAEMAVVSLSNGIQVDPEQSRRVDFCEAHGIDNLFYPDQRVAEICERLAIPCLTLAPMMLEKAEQSGVYFHGFENTQMGTGHWNEAGHRFAGEQISRFLDDAELIDRAD